MFNFACIYFLVEGEIFLEFYVFSRTNTSVIGHNLLGVLFTYEMSMNLGYLIQGVFSDKLR